MTVTAHLRAFRRGLRSGPARLAYHRTMFETDVSSRAVAQLVDGAIDDVGTSPRRWAVILIVLIVAVLGLLFVTRRMVADNPMPPADSPERGPQPS